MSLSDAKQKFSELQENITDRYAPDRKRAIKSSIDLLKEYPVLCFDALKMIKDNSKDINDVDKIGLLSNIMEIKPELNIDIIKNIGHFIGDYFKDQFLVAIVKNYPELFPQAKKVADDETSIIKAFIDAKDKLSEKDVDMIMGQFSLKKFRNLYSEDMKEGLKFIEKFSKGNPENTEIQKKSLLLLQIYNSDNKAKDIASAILTLQPTLKEFNDSLNLLSLHTPTFPKLKKIENTHNSSFKYTTGQFDLTQLQNRMNVKRDKHNVLSSYLEQIKKKQETMLLKINEIDKFINENVDLGEVIKRFNSLAEQIKKEDFYAAVTQKLQNQRDKIKSKIVQTHKFYGTQMQKVLNSPEKLNKLLCEINFSDDTSSVLVSNLSEIAMRTKNKDTLEILAQKKEEAYGVWDYDDIRELEKWFDRRDYITETLNKKYPDLPLEEQLIQAAYDVVTSGDEQKKKEFNKLILAEGEPRLAELDAKVMDYLHENCTRNNLDKVNALRSFYGLKVELKTGNTVDIDERTAVRKVFDRTWSSYERGKNAETGEPYYSEAKMEKARRKAKERGEEDPVQSNPYYENAVSPAYRKYFEEHDIYEIYHAEKSDEDKKYSAQDYFDSLIDKSPFKALRKHGLYNDMKIICDTLEALQVEPEISSQFNLKDLSDMVVNSHNTLEDRKVYTQDYEAEFMFTKSPHTDELDGNWRDPYYWHQYDDDDDEYDDEYDDDDYDYDDDRNESKNSMDEKQYDEEGFEIISEDKKYSETLNEEPAARDTWWENLADHNPKAVKHISEAFARHGKEDYAISGFWEAASYGTPGVGSRRDERLLSATLHHAEAIQYGGSDDKKNFVGATRYYDSYGDTFDEDEMHVDYHKSFHRRDTPMDALYINPNANSVGDKLATADKPTENAQKAFLETSFTDPHMHFYAGFRKIDQYTAPLYHMRNIEKEKQERVDKTEKSLEYLTKLGNALSSISVCISEALKAEEKIVTATGKITQKIKKSANHNETSSGNAGHSRSAKNSRLNNNQYE